METSPKSPKSPTAAQSKEAVNPKMMKLSDLIKFKQLPPLDYSWKDIKSMKEIVDMDPRSGKRKADKKIVVPGEKEESKADPNSVIIATNNTHEEKKNVLYQMPITSAIRLNNNSIENLLGFTECINTIMETPQRLSWLDLSFNKLTHIDAALLKYPNLSNLNLHANHIEDMKEIRKLADLPNLRMLTLHGNPIVEKKHYRLYIISTLPNLQSLDFSPITKKDRDEAITWHKLRHKKDKSPTHHK